MSAREGPAGMTTCRSLIFGIEPNHRFYEGKLQKKLDRKQFLVKYNNVFQKWLNPIDETF